MLMALLCRAETRTPRLVELVSLQPASHYCDPHAQHRVPKAVHWLGRRTSRHRSQSVPFARPPTCHDIQLQPNAGRAVVSMPFRAHQISLNCLHPTEGSSPPSDISQIKLIFLDMCPIGLLGLYYGTLSGSTALRFTQLARTASTASTSSTLSSMLLYTLPSIHRRTSWSTRSAGLSSGLY